MQTTTLLIDAIVVDVAILVIFLTQWLKFGDDLATAVFHTFSMMCYVFPILGAILSDGYIGKYK